MTIQFRKYSSIPDLSVASNKRLFYFLSGLLIIGGTILIFTFLFLIFNLDRVEELLYICLPGLALGTIFMVLYGIGSKKLIYIKPHPRRRYFSAASARERNYAGIPNR